MATIEESFNRIWRIRRRESCAPVQRLFERHSRRAGAGFRRGNDYGDSAEQCDRSCVFIPASPRHRHSRAASAGAVPDPVGRFHVRLRLHTEHARQDSLRVGRRPGGALLWQTVGWGFAVFVASSTRYYAIYSSFAILMLFSMAAHRLGDRALGRASELTRTNMYISSRATGSYWRRARRGAKKLVLHMMLLIGRNFYTRPRSDEHFRFGRSAAPACRYGQRISRNVRSNEAGLALADEETFVLVRDPETIQHQRDPGLRCETRVRDLKLRPSAARKKTKSTGCCSTSSNRWPKLYREKICRDLS